MSRWWRSLSRGSRALRAVVLLGPALAALLTAAQGPAPRPLLLLLLLLLGAAGAGRPESPLLTVALGAVGFWWALAARAEVPLSAVPAGWLLLGVHVAATLLAYGPAELSPEPALVRLWARRALVLGLLPPAVWALATAVHDRPGPAGIWAAGLLVAAAVCVLGGAAAFAPGAPGGDSSRSVAVRQRGRWG